MDRAGLTGALRSWLIAALVSGIIAGSATGRPALIGINFNQSGLGPTNWTTVNGGPSFYLPNLIDESGLTTGVSFTASSPVAAGIAISTIPHPTSVPSHSQSLASLGGYVWGVDEYNMRFEGLAPGQMYELWVFGLRVSDLGNRVTVSGGNDDITFTQTDPEKNLWVNGRVGDASLSLSELAIIQTADPTGRVFIRVTDEPDVQFGVWAIGAIAIRAVPGPGVAAVILCAGLMGCRRRR